MKFADLILQYLPLLVGFILAIASGYYFQQFFFPSRHLHKVLDTTIRQLSEIKRKFSGVRLVALEHIQSAMDTDELRHLWNEYAETLHPQKRTNEAGQLEVACYRATSMAEVFFSEQTVVDTYLRVPFYKHLPGIFTGLGIIGTFSGLIYGLNEFQVTDDPKAVRDSLAILIQGVGHAFVVSAIAISLAMLCTWWTNRELTLRYRQVEKLCQLIDLFFDTGAGEEYLARLVDSSESSALLATQLNNSLLTGLRQMMTELSQNQIAAQQQAIAELGNTVKNGNEAIVAAMIYARDEQSSAVTQLLTDVLNNFSERLEKMFGGQMHNMNELLLKTTQAMHQTADKFDALAGNMDEAGKKTVDAMSERLNLAIVSMEARQGAMNGQMEKFVEQLRMMVHQSQSESAQKMQETITLLGDKVAAVIGQVQDQSREHVAHQTHAVANLSTLVEMLIGQLVKTSGELQMSVSALTSATTSSIERMNSGAALLSTASHDFAQAGQGVAETMKATADTSAAIYSSVQTLTTITSSVREIMSDYRHTSDVLALMLEELKLIMEVAKKEAGLTSEVVEQFKSASDCLGQAQQQAGAYLQGINKVLAESHQSFANEIAHTLRQGNSQFQHELSTAIGLLQGGIKELGETLDDLSVRKEDKS